ncbi:MAG: hypothetical protein RIM72_21435 [Alphaproteobacteria bacterium]
MDSFETNESDSTKKPSPLRRKGRQVWGYLQQAHGRFEAVGADQRAGHGEADIHQENRQPNQRIDRDRRIRVCDWSIKQNLDP